MATQVHATEPTQALVRESAELAAALKQARLVRLILFLALAVFVVVAGWAAIAKANEFASPKNLDRLADVAGRRLEQKSDYFHKQLALLVDKVAPPMQDAFAKQATKDMPLYLRALERERGPLVNNLEKQFAEIVRKRYQKLRPRYERILHQEFPHTGDKKAQERMLENLDVAMDKMLKKYLVKELQDQLAELIGRWDSIPPAAAPRPGELPTEDQFVAALFDLARYRLTHNQASPF